MARQQPLEFKKLSINLTKRQHKEFTERADKLGIPLAEYVRRVLDAHLERKE